MFLPFIKRGALDRCLTMFTSSYVKMAATTLDTLRMWNIDLNNIRRAEAVGTQ